MTWQTAWKNSGTLKITNGPAQSMAGYISKFDQKHNRIMKLHMKLSSAVLAFMLLKKAKITKSGKMLVLTGMDYSKKD